LRHPIGAPLRLESGNPEAILVTNLFSARDFGRLIV